MKIEEEEEEQGATFWSPGEAWRLGHKKLTLTILPCIIPLRPSKCVSHSRPVLRRVQTVDRKRNLQANYPWPGWIWRTCQASSDWSSHRLSRLGLVRTAREVDKPLRWASQTSTPPDKSTNRPLYQGADGNACREGRMWYVTTYYACLLLKDGTGGESEGGFHLFLRQPCKPQSRVWYNSNSSWVFDTRGLQRSKILPVTYLGWASSSFWSEWTR